MNMRKLNKLKEKAYREAYVDAHLQQGLAYQIRALRESRGWDQRDLAERIGLKSQSAVARIEDPSYGRLSMSTLRKIARAFDVGVLLKFVPFSRLLKEIGDINSQALAVQSFDAELEELEREADAPHTAAPTSSVAYSTVAPQFTLTIYPRELVTVAGRGTPPPRRVLAKPSASLSSGKIPSGTAYGYH